MLFNRDCERLSEEFQDSATAFNPSHDDDVNVVLYRQIMSFDVAEMKKRIQISVFAKFEGFEESSLFSLDSFRADAQDSESRLITTQHFYANKYFPITAELREMEPACISMVRAGVEAAQISFPLTRNDSVAMAAAVHVVFPPPTLKRGCCENAAGVAKRNNARRPRRHERVLAARAMERILFFCAARRIQLVVHRDDFGGVNDAHAMVARNRAEAGQHELRPDHRPDKGR